MEHFHEPLLRHEVRAGAGRQIPAGRQQFHRPVVDLLVPPGGAVHRFPGFSEGRRIQNDKIVRPWLDGRKQVEDVHRLKAHPVGKAVSPGILLRHGYGFFGDVHGVDVLRPAHGGIQAEGAGVGEAV